MASLLPKLDEILKEKYKLKKSVKWDVEILKSELKSMHAALGNVAEVPREQLEEHVKDWDKQVRELSHRTEVVVDTFQARILGSEGSTDPDSFKRLTNKMEKLFRRAKARHEVAYSIKRIKDQIQDLANQNGWYRDWCEVVAEAEPKPEPDPRLKALYTESADLVGINGKREELIKWLVDGDEVSKMKLKTVSIVGFGGLGKTTLAKAVYDKIKGDFDCTAFVSVGEEPDAKKVLMDILFNVDKQKSAGSNPEIMDERQLIDELRSFLQNKRYLAVIDDIWEGNLWGVIKCAFPDENNLGSRLITTSRMKSVSRACCLSSEDSVYEMQPLNDDDSKRLFYKRLGFEENDCPQNCEQAYDEILKKCAGIPLAIIVVACLFRGHQQIKSLDARQILSIITGESSWDNLRRILSLSYDDLPSHLKSCLLYLSVFPIDYKIERDRLIRRWIAESLIQSRRGLSLFEVGESYFYELVNRSMIELINTNCEGRVEFCRVHGIVLDFICYLSSEDNFVTVLGKQSTSTPQSKIRRLSLQNGLAEPITHRLATTSMLQVRSVTVFGPAVNVMPSLSCFRALRVLDLEDSDLVESYHKINLSCVGNLFHLRYLGLKDANVDELLMELGKLQFLQTLCVRGNGTKELPPSAIKLRHLMCLHIEGGTTLPVGARNLTSLEELNKLQVDHLSPYIVEELGYMIELRVLVIYWGELDESLHKTLVESLSNLHKLQSLKIESWGGHIDLMQEGWNPPRHLCRFESCGDSFSTMPRWINTSSLPALSHLAIYVDKVQSDDIQNLGVLPSLRSIILNVTGCIEKATVEGFMVHPDAFPCLRECCFNNFVTVPSMFPSGAMPRLRFLRFSLRACDIISSNLDFEMGHLPSLERVHVDLWCQEASTTEVKQIEAALRHAAETHPNSPAIDIHFGGREPAL